MEEGFDVSLPLLDTGYDLISDHEGYLRRVQVKTASAARSDRRKYQFGTRGAMVYTDRHCDALICVALDTEQLFIFPRERIDAQCIRFSLDDPCLHQWSVLKRPGGS